MNQEDSTSDSDSNTSSWIFVDECVSDNETDKNKYYLNCSTEPVQELTPQCLNSLNLEQETDSDGISIISETDECKESSSGEEQIVTESNAVSIENVTPHVESKEVYEVKDEYYFNKFVIVGWILIALTTPILLNYFTTYKKHIVINRDEHTSVNSLQDEVNDYKSQISANILNVARKSKENNKEILDYRACEISDREIDIHDGKKKYDSKGEVDVHRIECRDGDYPCDEYKAVSIKKIIKDKKGEVNDKKHIKKPLSLVTDNIKSSKVSFENKKYRKQEHNVKLNKKKYSKEKDEHDNNPEAFKRQDSKKKNDKKKFKNHGKEHKKNDKKDKNKENSYFKENKKLKKILQDKDNIIKELTRLIKLKDKQLKFMEYKVLKKLNTLNKPEIYEKIKSSENGNFYKNNATGEWYSKMHEGRNSIRNQQHTSDWIFDRADYRNRRRNTKDNWYWNWMTDREQLRLKRGFWQYTY